MMALVLEERLWRHHLLLAALQPLGLPRQMQLTQRPVPWLRAMLRWGRQEQPLRRNLCTHAPRRSSGQQQRILLHWTGRPAQYWLTARAAQAQGNLPAPLQGLHRIPEVAAVQAPVACKPLMPPLGGSPVYSHAWPSTICQQHSAASHLAQVRVRQKKLPDAVACLKMYRFPQQVGLCPICMWSMLSSRC